MTTSGPLLDPYPGYLSISILTNRSHPDAFMCADIPCGFIHTLDKRWPKVPVVLMMEYIYTGVATMPVASGPWTGARLKQKALSAIRVTGSLLAAHPLTAQKHTHARPGLYSYKVDKIMIIFDRKAQPSASNRFPAI